MAYSNQNLSTLATSGSFAMWLYASATDTLDQICAEDYFARSCGPAPGDHIVISALDGGAGRSVCRSPNGLTLTKGMYAGWRSGGGDAVTQREESDVAPATSSVLGMVCEPVASRPAVAPPGGPAASLRTPQCLVCRNAADEIARLRDGLTDISLGTYPGTSFRYAKLLLDGGPK